VGAVRKVRILGRSVSVGVLGAFLAVALAGSAVATYLCTRTVNYGGHVSAWGTIYMYSDEEMTVPFESFDFGDFQYVEGEELAYSENVFYWKTAGNQAYDSQNVTWSVTDSAYSYGGGHVLVQNTDYWAIRVSGIEMIRIYYSVDGVPQNTDDIFTTTRDQTHNSTVRVEIYEDSLVGDFGFNLNLISNTV
jgi:hypothetical protein